MKAWFEKLKNRFNNLTQEQLQTTKKWFLLTISVISTFMVVLLMFTPFCSCSYTSEYKLINMSPIDIFALLNNPTHPLRPASVLNLVIFIIVAASIIVDAILLFKNISAFGKNDKALFTTKFQLLFSSLITIFYFLGGIIVCAVALYQGFTFRMVSNFFPAAVLLILDLAYAIILGFLDKQSVDNQETEQTAKKQKVYEEGKEIFKARTELFIFTSFLFALALFAMLSNIITATATSNTLTEKVTTVNISGLDLLRTVSSEKNTELTVGFILLMLLVLLSTTFFLSLISFLSRSQLFYKITVASISASMISLFLVGMFGKYYQMVQNLNSELFASLSNFDFTVDFTVKSSSLYYFFIAVVVMAVLLVRNPYTKGITIERELTLRKQSENPHTVKGEIALTDIPDNAVQRNDGTILSNNEAGEQTVWFADPCPIFTELDNKIPQFQTELEEKRQALFDNPTLPKLVQFIVQYARDSRLHLSYTEEDIATFVAGLGATKLSILQGMSGTGKTSLPKIFSEALYARCEIVEVESSWRDKNELLGYYNEFSKNYTPKKFTQALYRAKLNPETLTLIVLDEMNLSRIEYYFSDFLSLMENEPDKRELRLVNVSLYRTEKGEKVAYQGLCEGHTLQIPSNVWFIGTANRDESTFEISDKVYDRAHTMNFNKRAAKVSHYNEPLAQRFLPLDALQTLFEKANRTVQFNIDSYPVIAEVERLLAPYNISFGNRIATQIEKFVNVYASCFASSASVIPHAVEQILLSKVVSKLELKSVDNKEQLAAEFKKLQLHKCSEFILKLNED